MNIAIVPLRSGSKSIKNKNIKDFCGKPLCYWVLKELQECDSIANIIVSLDSNEYMDLVSNFKFDKILIQQRSEQTSTDEASTESVMIEVLNNYDFLSDNTKVILVQVTNPFTRKRDIEQALFLLDYKNNHYDSIISVVPFKRFLWRKSNDRDQFDGDYISDNYNYLNRKRRQDFFSTQYLENGAFYISTKKQILSYLNRLGVSVGIYEMDDYAGIEIDELDDWDIAEFLFKKYQNYRIEENVVNYNDLINESWNFDDIAIYDIKK